MTMLIENMNLSLPDQLPSLVFAPDGELYSQHGVIERIQGACSFDTVVERFYHSLKSGDSHSFRRFCLRDYDQDHDDANYMIYPLVTKHWLPFRFAFCEKVSYSGQTVTVVFFADHLDEFHTLMSPASPICRDTAGKLLCDLFQLRHRRRSNWLTPESLLLFEEFPLLEKAALDSSMEADAHCDLLRITKDIFNELHKSAPFRDTDFTMDLLINDSICSKPRNEIIVPCPVEAYIYMTVILGYLFSCISSDHRISSTVSYFGPGAEVVYSVRTLPSGSLRSGCSNLVDLFPEAGNLSYLAKVASAIGHIFGIRINLSYDHEAEILTTHVSVGYEKFVPVHFRYNNPYELVTPVLREVFKLLA